jgi:hypothetical protein
MMHILSMAAHMDKAPTNALIAKAVEVCHEQGYTHLIYGKYSYGRISHSSLTEFKVRNGFRKYDVPRYFVPMTLSGRLALSTGLHLGFKNLLPEPAMKLVLNLRAKCSRIVRARNPTEAAVNSGAGGESSDRREETVISG